MFNSGMNPLMHTIAANLKRVLAALVLLAAVTLAGAPASAQHNGGQVESFIERNAELLEWAAEIVGETDNITARRVLEEAMHLHQRSFQMMGQGRPVNAMNLAQRSRAGLWRAVGLAREALSYEERIRLRAERFRDFHGQLLDMARESQDRQALEFIDRAEEQASRAREQYLQGHSERAFKLQKQAEKILQRAARLLADGAGPERLARELERSATLVQGARERLGDDADPAALNLMTEAEQALDRSREHRDQGQPGRALQMAGLARRLASRALSLTGTGPDAESVQAQLESWDRRAAVVSEKVQASGSEPARRHLELAHEHRTRAGEALAAGKVELALRQIRAAGNQLSQAEGLTR